MRKTIRKCFWVWDFDKEECSPASYHVRLELLENIPTHPESQAYIKFLEETGCEYLGSIMRWVYFRKKTDDGEFNLYSDSNSRIKHLNRILLLLGILGITNLLNGINILMLSPFCGALCLGFSFILAFGFLKVYWKKKRLQKEQRLFE